MARGDRRAQPLGLMAKWHVDGERVGRTRRGAESAHGSPGERKGKDEECIAEEEYEQLTTLLASCASADWCG